MKLEFVGGPLDGQQHQVNALPAEYDAAHRPGDGQEWRVTYVRSGLLMKGELPVYRYNFAGQRRAEPSSL